MTYKASKNKCTCEGCLITIEDIKEVLENVR